MSNRPGILFVTVCLDVGGTELHLLDLLPRLTSAGFDVALFALKPGGTLSSRFRAAGIEIFESTRTGDDLRGLINCTLFLLRHLLTHRYDVVHYYLPAAYIVGAICTLFTSRAKRIMSRRSLNLYQLKSPVLRILEHRLHPFMHRIVGNSSAVLNDLEGEGVAPAKLELIHNGVTVPAETTVEQRARTRAEIHVPQDALVLVYVANLFPYKGHTYVLDALALVAPNLPTQWRMLIVGRDTGIGADLQAQATRLGISHNLVWLGEQSEPTPILQAADIGLQCSLQEGFSNALLESMAAGLPIIATTAGGNIDAVIDGDSGLLVPIEDSRALADAITRLAQAADLRTAMGGAARQRVAEVFSPELCVEKYLDLYRRVLI